MIESVSRPWSARVFVMICAGVFAFVGIGLVIGITGFGGPALAQCVAGAPSVRGLTAAVGGGVMATRLCGEGAPGFWSWPLASLLLGACVGGFFAVGLIQTLRAMRRAPKITSDLGITPL